MRFLAQFRGDHCAPRVAPLSTTGPQGPVRHPSRSSCPSAMKAGRSALAETMRRTSRRAARTHARTSQQTRTKPLPTRTPRLRRPAGLVASPTPRAQRAAAGPDDHHERGGQSGASAARPRGGRRNSSIAPRHVVHPYPIGARRHRGGARALAAGRDGEPGGGGGMPSTTSLVDPSAARRGPGRDQALVIALSSRARASMVRQPRAAAWWDRRLAEREAWPRGYRTIVDAAWHPELGRPASTPSAKYDDGPGRGLMARNAVRQPAVSTKRHRSAFDPHHLREGAAVLQTLDWVGEGEVQRAAFATT